MYKAYKFKKFKHILNFETLYKMSCNKMNKTSIIFKHDCLSHCNTLHITIFVDEMQTQKIMFNLLRQDVIRHSISSLAIVTQSRLF